MLGPMHEVALAFLQEVLTQLHHRVDQGKSGLRHLPCH